MELSLLFGVLGFVLAAYAVIAYQTAYLKTYHSNEFIAASMSNDMSSTEKLSEFFRI